MEIKKSSRHAKILGDLGEQLICNWLSRSGWEVILVDHTGIDLIAYHKKRKERIGITVKSRTRVVGKEKTTVNVLKTKNSDRGKLKKACKDFGCNPWIGIYVETSDSADLFLTSLSNYDNKYRVKTNKAIDDWKMGDKYLKKYEHDRNIHHLHIKYESKNWEW